MTSAEKALEAFTYDYLEELPNGNFVFNWPAFVSAMGEHTPAITRALKIAAAVDGDGLYLSTEASHYGNITEQGVGRIFGNNDLLERLREIK